MSAPRSRVAIVGAGAAGTTAAWLLAPRHDVTVFEAADRPGGHAHTVAADVDGHPLPVELGAEFAFEISYGGLTALVDRLGLVRGAHPLSVSMTIDEGRTTFAVPPRTAYAVWRCLPPRTLRRLYWLRALGVGAEQIIATADWSVTVGGLIERIGMPRDVADGMAIPLVAASWGVEREQAVTLAAYSVARVMWLRVEPPPPAVALDGGLATYIRALFADAPGIDLRLGAPVTALGLDGDRLVLSAGDPPARFDAVVLACDWHTAAAICAREPKLDDWRRAFAAFADTPVRLALHRDRALMPAHRRLWANANFDLSTTARPRTTVWSGARTGAEVFRTWLRPGEAPPPSTQHVAEYRHVVVDPDHPARQARLAALQGRCGLFAAGMYTTGIDSHESAVRSALRVGQHLAPDTERVRWLAEHVSE